MTDETPTAAPKKARSVGRRHPLLAGLDRGKWYPEMIGKIPGYCKSQEAFDRRQASAASMREKAKANGKNYGRVSIPDGYGGMAMRAVLEELRAEARVEAKGLITTMTEKGIIDPDEDPRGDIAIEEALAILVARDPITEKPLESTKDRIAAARLVADFCKIKPERRVKNTLASTEDFLGALLGRAV